MTSEDFVLALERYGGNLSRWPRELGEAARALLVQSPASGAALDHARAFDAYLRANDPAAAIEPERCVKIIRRVMAQTHTVSDDRGSSVWRWRSLACVAAPVRVSALRFAATALTAATLGVLAGRGLTQVTDGEMGAIVANSGVVVTTAGLAALLHQPQLMLAEPQ
ncbi:hypothetical protein [Defluviicoccus vanus]|uniref:Uncharacterized protein n=1 Tax=Defluviicoccus vanus TaxID=111831 RepID=A0A7H1N2L8_9PROT|nr:hypothetical protein [Defluviicoccus vanus]QNT69954.1 hypothetical protein HQ394_12225 [Defluviicoccus vanus]